MGARLISFYEFVKQEAGIRGQMRLAMMTNLPSAKAKDAPDSPETIQAFQAATKEITGKDAPA